MGCHPFCLFYITSMNSHSRCNSRAMKLICHLVIGTSSSLQRRKQSNNKSELFTAMLFLFYHHSFIVLNCVHIFMLLHCYVLNVFIMDLYDKNWIFQRSIVCSIQPSSQSEASIFLERQ